MQGGSSGIVYGGLKYQASSSSSAFWNLLEQSLLTPRSSSLLLQARCIADVRADAGSTTFLAGTLSLKEENEVRVLQPWRRVAPGGIAIRAVLFCRGEMAWDLIWISNPLRPSRFTWSGCRRRRASSCATASSTTPTRSGTSNHAPSITGSSPPSTPLVKSSCLSVPEHCDLQNCRVQFSCNVKNSWCDHVTARWGLWRVSLEDPRTQWAVKFTAAWAAFWAWWAYEQD